MSESTGSQFVFQFIYLDDGSRSEPFVSSLQNLGKALAALPDASRYLMMVLVLAPVVDGELSDFSRVPLMKVETFLSWYNSTQSTTTEESSNV